MAGAVAGALAAAVLLFGGSLRVLGQEADAEKELKTGSRAPYVHRLTLYDENGTAIDPGDELAGPYSPRMTCGKCHPCGQIAGGWHFDAERDARAAGRTGEAWLLVNAVTGTQLPISGRGWEGTFKPAAVGLTDWQFVKRFGAHTPGGCYGAPEGAALREAPEKVRWAISGPLDIDCMFCHSADQQHDPAEAATQIEAENFKWAPTAALGLAAVRGEARKAPDDWQPDLPPNPDHPEQAGPKLVWNKLRFDVDDRVLFNIVRRPANERCYFCHSVHAVGPGAPDEERSGMDVHLAAGLLCVDCHRNGMDHMIARGHRGEATERDDAGLAAFSCAGCHLGVAGAADPELAQGGRYAAPRPEHRGLPPLHLEKLTCTACHSGSWPAMEAGRFQTSLAHGLGLATRDRDADTLPNIVGPVFARQPDGQLAPQRLVWPAYWARQKGDRFEPIPLDVVQKAVAKAAPQRAKARGAKLAALDDEQIRAILEQLGKSDTEHVPAYIRDGVLYRHSPGSELQKTAYQPPPAEEDADAAPRAPDDAVQIATAPYRWSFAHDVRPAVQSLGVGGCTDCHAEGAPLYYGSIAAAGVPSGPADLRPMYRFRGEDGGELRAWTLGFVFRPAFKWLSFACVAGIVLVLLRAVVSPGRPTSSRGDWVLAGAGHMESLALALCFLGLAIQFATGYGSQWILGETEGWPLYIHMLGAPLLITGVTGVAVFGAARHRWIDAPGAGLQNGRTILFWIAVTCGLMTMVPMLAAMTPLFSSADQEWLTAWHARAGMGLLISSAMYYIVLRRLRRRRGIEDELEKTVAAAGRTGDFADNCSGSVTGG